MRCTIVLVLALMITACGGDVATTDNLPPEGAVMSTVNEIEPEDALLKVKAAYSQFIDVRTREEYSAGHAIRARNIPLDELPAKLDILEKNEPIYVICQTGRRSKEAAELLSRNGFKWVFNVTGGTEQWQADVLPMDGVKSD